MKYVIAAFVLMLVSSCTKTPKIEMQTLSQNLAQMKSTGTSPFDQDFNSNRYVIFSGQCIALISKFQVSINESGIWYDVPATEPTAVVGSYTVGGNSYTYNEVNTPPGTYDVSCSDGTYNFWIYDHQLDEIGFATGLDPGVDIHPTAISVRGLAGVFATSPTVYRDPNGVGSNTATKIGLRKSGSPVGNSPWQCTELVISLSDANDLSASLAAPTSFSLSRTVNGSGGTMNVYTDFASCNSMIAANQLDANNISIPANSSERRVVFKPDGTTGDINVITLGYSGALTLSPATSAFTMKDSASKFIEFDGPWGILTGYCYPINVNLRSYGGSTPMAAGETFNITATGNLQVFSTAGCTGPISNFSLSGVSSKTIYIQVAVGVTANLSTLQVSATGYDLGETLIKYDKSNAATVASVRVDGPNSINFWEVPQMRVSRVNSHGTPIPLGSSLTVNLSVGQNKGVFCSDSGCMSQVTSVIIPSGEATATVFFKPQLGGLSVLSSSATGVSATDSNVQVMGGLSKLALTTAPTVLDHYGCYKYVVETKDSSDFSANASFNMTLAITGPSSSDIYSDPICSIPLASVTVPNMANKVTFYWKPLNITFATINTSVVASYPGITSATAAVTIGQAPSLNVVTGGPHPVAMAFPIFPQYLASGAAPFSMSINSGGGTINSANASGQVYQNYFIAPATNGTTTNLAVSDARAGSQNTDVITVAPKLELDFTVSDNLTSGGAVKVNGSNIASGWTFTRASTAYRYAITGYLESIAANTPRIDYDPTSPGCSVSNCARKGLLIEPAATNLIINNTTMASGWNNMQGGSIGTAPITNPTGSIVATPYVSENDTGNPGAVDTIFLPSTTAGKYTASVYLKNNTGAGFPALYWGETLHSCSGLVVNLTTGTGGPLGYCGGMPPTYDVQKLRGGWYRVIMTMNFDGGYQGNFRIYPTFNTDGSSSPQNAATGTVWVYGLQIEYGDMATSMIPTAGAAATRSGDSIKFPTTIGSTWYSGLSVGTFMMEWISASQSGAQVQIMFKDASSGNHVLSTVMVTGSVTPTYSSSSGANLSLPPQPPKLGLNRASFSFSNTGQVLSSNSISNASATGVSNPTNLNNLYVGSDLGGLNQTVGHIQKLKYFEAELHPASVKSMGFIEP